MQPLIIKTPRAVFLDSSLNIKADSPLESLGEMKREEQPAGRWLQVIDLQQVAPSMYQKAIRAAFKC